MADVNDKKKQKAPEKEAAAEKELTILQPGAVPEEEDDPEAPIWLPTCISASSP